MADDIEAWASPFRRHSFAAMHDVWCGWAGRWFRTFAQVQLAVYAAQSLLTLYTKWYGGVVQIKAMKMLVNIQCNLFFSFFVGRILSFAGPALQLIKYLKYFIGFGIMLDAVPKQRAKKHTDAHQEKYF